MTVESTATKMAAAELIPKTAMMKTSTTALEATRTRKVTTTTTVKYTNTNRNNNH